MTLPQFEARQAPPLGAFDQPATVEVRSPRGATVSDRPVGSGHSWAQMEADWIQRAYLANTFVYACVRAIAQDLASLPFRVGADPEKPADFDTRNPLAQMLGPPPHGPNPRTSARKLWMWIVAQYLLTGKFGIEKERQGGRNGPVVGLWPLVSRFLTPLESDGGADWFKGFAYDTGARKVNFDRDEIVYEWRPAQDDWRKPESVLAASRLDIEVAVMTDRYDRAFLSNDARPAAIVVHSWFDDDAERRKFREQFHARHRGPDNAGSIAFAEADGEDGSLSGAIDVKQLGLTQKDAQMIERYDAKLRAITVAFGCPLSRLGDASKRTFSNSKQEWSNYWTSTIGGLAVELADAVNMQLAPELAPGMAGWFDMSRVEALDRTARPTTAAEAVTLVKGKVATKNEGREFVGLPPTDGGDEFAEDPPLPAPSAPTVDPAAATADAAAGAGEPTRAAAPPPAPGPAAHVEDEATLADEERRLAEERARIEEERRAGLWRDADADVLALEDQFEQRFDRLLTRQRRAVLDRLEGKRGRQTLDVEQRAAADRAADEGADAVFDRAFWIQQTAEETALLFRSVAVQAGRRTAGRLGVAFDVSAPWVTDFVQQRAHQLAGNVTDTTYHDIRTALVEGIKAGEGIPQLAARIRNLFDQTYKSRAVTVARTEVISAYNGSTILTGASYGPDVVAAAQWIATRDSRTRHSHAAVDGVIVPTGGTWNVGGHEMAYPGDPNGPASEVVNCRCAVALLTPKELAARSERSARLDIQTAARLLTDVSLGRRDAGATIAELRAGLVTA